LLSNQSIKIKSQGFSTSFFTGLVEISFDIQAGIQNDDAEIMEGEHGKQL
jgi:hypothetical protein